MNEDDIVKRLGESLERMAEEPTGKLFARLQERGIIDAEGRVLKRIPTPPQAAANGKTRKSTPSRKTPRRSSRG